MTDQPLDQPIDLRLDRKVYGSLWKSKNGEAIPDSEFLVFRIHDPSLIPALQAHYFDAKQRGASPEQLQATEELTQKIQQWQADHPERVHVADLEPGELTGSPVTAQLDDYLSQALARKRADNPPPPAAPPATTATTDLEQLREVVRNTMRDAFGAEHAAAALAAATVPLPAPPTDLAEVRQALLQSFTVALEQMLERAVAKLEAAAPPPVVRMRTTETPLPTTVFLTLEELQVLVDGLAGSLQFPAKQEGFRFRKSLRKAIHQQLQTRLDRLPFALQVADEDETDG